MKRKNAFIQRNKHDSDHVSNVTESSLDLNHSGIKPSKEKKKQKRRNKRKYNKSYSYTVMGSRTVITGSSCFIKELKTRHFSSADPIISTLNGKDLTLEYLIENGFKHPILIKSKEGLDLKVPDKNFTVADVEKLIGSHYLVKVIKVNGQVEREMKLGDFISYLKNPDRKSALNLISLECSFNRLGKKLEPPLVARKLDWLNKVFPESTEEELPEKIEKYCLISAKDSYTDFHIDFGGTSVWYHVFSGEKIFYLIEPTEANLNLFTGFYTSSVAKHTFFADQVDQCYTMKLMAGNTLLIPTGWIHAVYTPVDSMVFGGNYFHNLNIPLQLRIYDLEKKTSCESKYMFEKFEEVHWFAARMLATELKKLNVSKTKVPEYLLTGVKALISVMKIWNSSPSSIKSIPKEIDSNGLIRTMSKEVRLAEKLINSSHPPKQGRESKRKRKKPVHDDFISSSMLSELLPSPFKVKKKRRKFDETLMSPKTVSRPPLKLTLPKPVTYPYCSLPKEIPDTSIKTEVNNKEWVVSKDSNTKNNKDGLVVKLCSKLSNNVKSNWSINSLPSQLYSVDPEKMATKEIENTFGRFADKQSVSSVKPDNFTDVLHTCYQEKPRETSGIAMNGQSSNYCSFLKFDTSSVYDFHESSDEEKDDNRLTIDEEPNKVLINKLHKPKKNLHLTYFDGAVVQNKSSMNGIENLLKASSFTRDRNNIDDIEAGRASPATRDAVAGILSISQSCYGSSSNSESESTSQKGRKIKFLNDEEEEEMIKVHQDDEFVYTPLDSSDDDDIKWMGKISKKSYDEAWNPKARVGPVTPKTDRPCREGTKKQAVEKGLEAAAAKKAGMPPPKRTYIRKKLKVDKEICPKISKILVPSTSTGNPKGFMGMQQNSDLPKKKRKGMATPKQRLGKILKIKT